MASLPITQSYCETPLHRGDSQGNSLWLQDLLKASCLNLLFGLQEKSERAIFRLLRCHFFRLEQPKFPNVAAVVRIRYLFTSRAHAYMVRVE